MSYKLSSFVTSVHVRAVIAQSTRALQNFYLPPVFHRLFDPVSRDGVLLQQTGHTYAVMRLRGSAFPANSQGYITANDDGTFHTALRWSRYARRLRRNMTSLPPTAAHSALLCV